MYATPWDTVSPEIEILRAQPPDPGRQTLDPESASSGAFGIPLICLGIGLIALCLLIPAADENRRLVFERERLQADLEQLQKQVAINDSFLKRVGDDATLSERLARRQMKLVPEGTAVLELKSQQAAGDMSPFLLVSVPPPAAMIPGRPVGGMLSNACRYPKGRLCIIGASLLMIAAGLVVDSTLSPEDAENGHLLAA